MTSKKYFIRQKKHEFDRMCFSVIGKSSIPSVLITGNQKSGTSAVAALLAKAIDKSSTIDIFPKMGILNFVNIFNKTKSFSQFIREADIYFSKPVVKDPDLLFFLPEVLQLFPESQIVVIVREPQDNIRSILNRISTAKKSSEVSWRDIEETSENAPLWKMMFDESLMPYPCDSIVSSMAHRWDHTFTIVEGLKEHIKIVAYEDFLENKEKFIDNLAHRLGYSSRRNIGHFKNKQYQPKGHSSKTDYFSDEHRELIDQICGDYQSRLFGLRN